MCNLRSHTYLPQFKSVLKIYLNVFLTLILIIIKYTLIACYRKGFLNCFKVYLKLLCSKVDWCSVTWSLKINVGEKSNMNYNRFDFENIFQESKGLWGIYSSFLFKKGGLKFIAILNLVNVVNGSWKNIIFFLIIVLFFYFIL